MKKVESVSSAPGVIPVLVIKIHAQNYTYSKEKVEEKEAVLDAFDARLHLQNPR